MVNGKVFKFDILSVFMEGHIPHSLEGISTFDSETLTFSHYTCNSPKQETLDKHGIKAVGDTYGCADSREVLKIPLRLYLTKFPFVKDKAVLRLNMEHLIAQLP